MVGAAASANGNITMSAGKCVNIKGAYTEPNESDMFDGKYLIIQLRHIFNMNTKKHEAVFKLVRDAINETVPKNGTLEYEEYESDSGGTFELE